MQVVCPDPHSSLANPYPSLVVWATHLSLRTAQFQQLGQGDEDIGDLLDCEEVRQTVTDRVGQNEDGQLDAWQQRYMLACLRFKHKGTTTQDENRQLDAIISERSEDMSDESGRSKIFTVSSIQ